MIVINDCIKCGWYVVNNKCGCWPFRRPTIHSGAGAERSPEEADCTAVTEGCPKGQTLSGVRFPCAGVWPDAKLEKDMLNDCDILDHLRERGIETFIGTANEVIGDVACHVRALLERIRELETEKALREQPPSAIGG